MTCAGGTRAANRRMGTSSVKRARFDSHRAALRASGGPVHDRWVSRTWPFGRSRTRRSAADGGHGPGRLQERSRRRCRARAACRASATRHRSASSSSSAPPRRAARRSRLLAGEQAVADLAVGGQPDPVAVTAERPGDRGDDADGGRTAVDQRTARRGRCPAAPRPASSVERGASDARISSAVTISLAAPAVLGVERHLLDEPQLVAVLEAPAQQLGRLVVVDAAQQHGVDLDRRQPRGLRPPPARPSTSCSRSRRVIVSKSVAAGRCRG